jgi:8-oxo-dGTP pyrophosphatase MutT (NUDIX family)
MKVFLSWSGNRSHKVALTFRDWLPSVIQSLVPFVSSEDIDKGSRWGTDIAKELEDSTFGILCVTKHNINAPWLIFEAGALSKKLDKAFVCPFLFDIERSEVDGPISQFQSTIFEKDDIRKLVRALNKACSNDRLSDERLDKTFDRWYPDLEKQLKEVNSIDELTVKEIKGSEKDDGIFPSPIFQSREMESPYEQLIHAHKAKIFALTYQTLGNSFTTLSSGTVFSHIEEIELYITSLPTLFTNHPILKIEADIEEEWRKGLEATINGLLSIDLFPNLKHIDVIVLSNIPILTGAVIEFPKGSQTNEMIIYTPVVTEIAPVQIPTLIHKKTNLHETVLYSAYKKLVENAGTPWFKLRFTVRKKEIDRPSIEEFIDHLVHVCNNPLYEPKDRLYSAEAMHEKLAKLESELVSPMAFADSISNQFKDGGLEITDHNAKTILFSYNSYMNDEKKIRISSEHFVAYFVLLIWKGKLLLIEHPRKDWPYDLPGGKRKMSDCTWHDTIVRETFEEIGVILDKKKFKDNFLGTVYDHRSAHQGGMPVIASYCYYLLDENEYNILIMQEYATKGYKLDFVSLKYILERKQEKNKIGSLEYFTHAPEFSIKMLCEKLGL